MNRMLMLASAALLGLSTLAWSDDAQPGRARYGEMGDPWVPPAARTPPSAAPTSGAALQRQVDAKLQHQFERADTAHSGRVTLEQARQAGWGYLVQHFDRIDAAGNGSVSFEQVRRYQSAATAR